MKNTIIYVFKKAAWFTILFCSGIVILHAQNPDTNGSGITADVMNEIRASVNFSAVDTALMNALTNNDVNALVVNREFLKKHNDLFSHEIKTEGITDQQSSGRCWLFAGLNVLRQHVIAKYKLGDFELSQSYLAFWDKLEKANFILEFSLQNADRDLRERELDYILNQGVDDGGYWEWFAALVEKYGVVPKDVYPETYPSSNTWSMTSALYEQTLAGIQELRTMAQQRAGMERLHQKKVEILKEVYRILVLNYSEPPREFIWRYENKDSTISTSKPYTPLSFYQEAIGLKLGDFVSVINDPTREYNRLVQFDNTRNIFDTKDPVHANVEISVLKQAAQKAIMDNEPVWFACDFGKETYGTKGIFSSRILDYRSLYRSPGSLDKKERILYRFTHANHAMVLQGMDIDPQTKMPIKWRVENSHGSESGHDGFFTLYDDWFNEYVFEIIVSIKYLPQEVREIYKQTPLHLAVWDPMNEMLKVDKD
ncbi:MAG TPA: C1 family peptidase [bacterium]